MSGNFTKNKRVIERLIKCINEKKISVMDELFHEDAIMDWPQSGEQVIGGDNRRAIYKSFPTLPKTKPRSIVGYTVRKNSDHYLR